MFSTGCEDLDLRIGGFSDGINLIYGTPATGKTTLGMITSNFFASKNKKVFYIDSENGFTVDRFKLISNNKLYENLIVFKVKNLDEQYRLIEKLPLKCDLLILDSLGYYYRSELRKDHVLANLLVKKHFDRLKLVSKKTCILIMNQVYCDITTTTIKCVGGNFVMNSCDTKIFLEKEPRILHSEGNKFEFEINNSGIIFP